MNKNLLIVFFCLAPLFSGPAAIGRDGDTAEARFSWFEYSGDDDVFKMPLSEDEYRNPILAGYHPDPSVVRVGEDYYLVNSTFGFFPGIPVFHSRDLVNWTQIGNALHRPGQVSFDGLPLTNAGVYAPAIEYSDGTFYVINTCVGCGGNFVVTATDPAGPWSDPIWMPYLDGIDPSIFFDDDGKTYVVHHGEPEKKRYPAHTAIRVVEVDPRTFKPLSEDVLLVDGGDVPRWNTDYLEGPHLYKVDGSYYLSAPGGGTGYYHQQLVFRSDDVFGPYTANPDNPILTQHGLPDDRKYPVTATGHADMFRDSNGDWWAVFLGTRVYDLDTPPQDPGNFHTGRETFLLPVNWQDGWPVILEKGRAVPYTVKKPDLPQDRPADRAMTGNFSVREEFTRETLDPHWMFIRTPDSRWWSTGKGALKLRARQDRIGERKQPSFVGRRLAHMKASFATEMYFNPRDPGDEAGLLALQGDNYFYVFGLGRNASGETVLRVRKKAGKDDATHGDTIAEAKIAIEPDTPIYLRMDVDNAELDFSYSLDRKNYQVLLDNADARVLTSAMAGGFVGAVVGMYAEGSAASD
ncbi:glycoside hydrolase family 43 protein [Microbulbifer litoralis]|uniref:glycoside hydrolase family 43 protein n=1 Tax=Microbulbifer litoralis TaxID=2933965 RepID=UPI002028A835